MRNLFSVLAFIISSQLCWQNFAFSAAPNKPFKVIIDPGHGGTDLGARRDRFIESEIVLAIAKKVKLKLDEKSYLVSILTREEDKTVSLKDRVQLANNEKADLFVSLHANSSYANNIEGLEFYFNSAHIPKSAQLKATSAEVVGQIQSDFARYEKTKKSYLLSKDIHSFAKENTLKAVIKRAPFYVIEETEMPSVLIELGFITNRREAQKLNSEDYQNQLATLISNSIVEYKENSDKTDPL